MLNAIDLVNEPLVGELGGERGHKVDSAVHQNQCVDPGSHGLSAGLGLRLLQLMLCVLQEISHPLRRRRRRNRRRRIPSSRSAYLSILPFANYSWYHSKQSL